MSLQGIYDELSAALSGESINLAWSTATGLDGVLSTIGLDAQGHLPLTRAQLSRGQDAVILTGNGSWRDFTWSTTLTGEEEASGASRFTLVLQGQDAERGWTFGTSFEALPQTRRQRQSDGALVLGPSVLAGLVVEGPRVSITAGARSQRGAEAVLDLEPAPTYPVSDHLLEASATGPRPRFEGWLRLQGSELEPYEGLLGGEQKLRLSGWLNFEPDAQLIELRAVAPGAELPVSPEGDAQAGLRATEVGLRLESAYPDVYALEQPAAMSAVVLYAKVVLGGKDAVATEVSAPLLQNDDLWPLAVAISPPLTLPAILRTILQLFGEEGEPGWLSFPLDLGLLSKFGLSGAELGIVPPRSGRDGGLSYASVQLRSSEEWDPPVPFVKVREIGTAWTFHWYDALVVTGNVSGKLTLLEGAGFEGIKLDLTATLPEFDLVARTEAPIAVPLGAMLEKYLGGKAGLEDSLKITEVLVEASPTRQTYHATLMVDSIWKVELNKVTFSLDRILGEVMASQSAVSGSVTGFASVEVKSGSGPPTKPVFIVAAAYDGHGEGSWTFEGGLADGKLSLLDFAWGLFGSEPPSWLPTLELTELWLTYATSAEHPYSARGTVVGRWKPELLGLELSLQARTRYARRPRSDSATDLALTAAAPHRAELDGDVEMISEGELYGTFSVNRLTVTAGLSFVDRERNYLLEVAWGSAALRAVTVNVEEEGGGSHEAIEITLHDITLGSLVEGLLKLADPNLDYRLEPPWDFLNSIDLSRFKMTIDPKLQTVTVTYVVALNLGFATLDSVGVRYDRSGGDPSVNFVLTGTLLGKDFRQKPLSWDAARESPPEVPGKGPRLFELRYLGLGQHVTLKGLTKYESVETVIAALRAEMQPPKKRDVNPLTGSGLSFEESSQWMLGLDCTVMDTVSLAIVMHDPDLYGLLVKLGGPEAKSLAGLELELLYKRVTDTVGVFRVRLQVPDAFRQIMLGPVSLTLGQITVDVFTNGNFMVDLGFPHQRDFSNSFGLQAGPFIGSGGLYFGVLNGATSKRVPAIVNGTFDPVVELGLGISAGVGRTFEKGPLKAGLYVQMEAIFEGVLGWFAPTDASAPRAMYYWAQGTAGLIGKLYGSVDFTVVRAAVSVEAHATVTVTVAAYRETLVELDVGVEVEAEVEIFWVSVSFSFSMDLHASFSIGESSTPPWVLAADQSGRQLLADAMPRRRLGAAAVRALTREAFLLGRDHPATAGAEPPYHLKWRIDVEVFPDRQVRPVAVKLLPAFGVDQVPVSWPGRSPAAESSEYRIAFLGLIDNDPSSGSTGTAFDPLSEAMLRWALSALELDPVAGAVSAGQLEELMRQLEMPETMQQGFSMEKLAGFFSHNLELRLSAIPAGEPSPTDGAAFPIPPPLGWDCPESTGYQRRFAEYRPVDSVYEREVGEYFAELDPRQGGGEAASAAEAGGGEAESMATFVFRDWFLMVAKAAVQAALDVIAAFPYRLAEGSTESLAAVCAHFDPVPVCYEKHLGDTVDQVAQALGMGLGELLALNPKIEKKLSEAAVGAEVEVLIGATPAGVAAANPHRPLVAGKSVPLGDLVHQVRDGETLKEIADRLGASLEAWLKTEALLDSRLLLRPGAPLSLPAASFINANDLDLKTVAALLYVRLRGTTDLHAADAQGVPLVDWYASAIASKKAIPQEGPLPETLEVPKAYDDFSKWKTWKTLPGDTVWRVAATLALAQNPVTDAGFEKWLGEVTALNPGSGPFPRLALPAATTAIEPGETLRGLSQRLPLELPDIEHSGQGFGEAASFQRIVEAAPVLAPLQPLTVPACTGTTQGGDTFSSFAQRYDLSLEDLGSRMATQSGLLALKQGEDLKVPHPASAKIGAATGGTGSPFEPWELVPAVLRTHGGKIAAQVSRFLLHGLRMPAPEKGSDGHYHPTGPKAGLFELTGQQLAGPPPVSGSDPATDRMVLEVKVFDQAASWLKLYESAAGENGAVALTDPVGELVVRITEGDLARYPARRLQHVFSAPPGPLPLVRATPVRHGLQQRILWQSTEAVALPNPGHAVEPVVGEKTIWPFPSDLRRAADAYPDEAFALRRTDPALGPAAQPVELSGFAWASAVALRVRRLPGQSNTYQLLGAGADGRADLLGLWRYLKDSGDSAGLHLLTRPAGGSGLPNGLVSVPPLDAETFLVKTNLSTRTVAPEASAVAGLAPTFGEYYARLTDSQRFLTLLWEGSVVGGAGYWLHYATADGNGLPESIFGDDESGEVTLLALLGTQASEPPSRKLHPFTNCAVVGESVDAAASSLFAAAAAGAETSLQATVAPGSVGFEMALEKPTKGAADSQSALRRLYSLSGYGLDKAGPFKGSQNPGLPVGPQVPAVSGTGKKAGDDRTWDLFQVVPVSRFAERSPAPEARGLPPAAEDPYAGIEGNGGGPAGAQVTVSFHDVLGNSSLESGKPEDGGPLPLSLPVGYTDPVIGVGAWPATASSFRVAPASSGEPGARLLVTLALQASGHVAAPGQRGSAAAAEAAKQLDRFRSVYYQLLQPDITAALLTTLEQAAGKPVRTEVPLDGLWSFAAGSCAWLGTAAALRDVEAGTGAGATLSEIVERAGVGFDQLAAANATVVLEKILASATIPTYVPFREGAAPEQLCPDPAQAAALLAEAENASLPLREGVEIAIPAHPATVPPDPLPPATPPTLRELAAANGITLASLAKANEKAKGLLRVGARFTCEGIQVEVTKEFPEVSLEDVAKTFNDQGVHFDPVMVAGANADAPGVLRPGASLEIDRAIALAGETLAANHTGVELAVLARENTKTPDLFPAGAPLFVSADPASAETMKTELARAAKLWGLAPEQLLRHNGGVALAAGATIALPGQAALPGQVEDLRVPYRIPREATLAGIAQLFAGADQQSLASASEELPGVVAGGKTIEVEGKSVQTRPGDSLADVRRRFDPEIGLGELVAAIGPRPGYLAEGALLLCPPAILPADAPSTLAAASARYGLDAPTLAGANAALAGIVVPGAEVQLTVGEERTVAVSSGPADTLNSLVWRFGQRGVSTTVGEIAAANPDVSLLRAGAMILLSPKPCELSAPVGATAAGWRFPEAIFPLQAWLELSRDPKLLDPSVRRAEGEGGPVTRDRTALAANATPARDRALALEGFARECQGAVPALRVATGKVEGVEEADVWAIVFDRSHIARVAIEPPAVGPQGKKLPQFYALAPLVNSLVSRTGVPIAPLDPEGKLGEAKPTDYQGTDLESWARRLLADVDLFVSAPYATALYQAGEQRQLETVLGEKAKLAQAIAEGLDYVLEMGQPQRPARQVPPPPDWSSAVETLRQRLLDSLAGGYATEVIAQYRAQVESPWQSEQARLVGAAKLPAEPTGDQRRARVSAAKTSLATGTSYVEFAVDVTEEGQQRSVHLPLEYAIGELELNIADVVSGYQSSDWLTLITPFQPPPSGVTLDLGEPDVPLPLRAYPSLPALVDQTAAPTTPKPKGYEEALRWDYTATFQHQSMATDQLQVEVEFNCPPLVGLDPPAPDLFAALAQYVAVAPELWEILGELPGAKLPIDPRLQNAVDTFAGLVGRIASAWAIHWKPPAEKAGEETAVSEGEKFSFTATPTPRFDAVEKQWYWETLLLSRDRSDLPWPQLSCFPSGGTAQPMKQVGEGPKGMVYEFPQGEDQIEAFGTVGYAMSFKGLHVAAYQNATSRISVVRNAHLLDSGPRTRDSFVYRTPAFAFASVTTPLLSWTDAFSVGRWSEDAVSNPLAPVLRQMLGGSEDGTISCEIRYGYELGGDPEDPLISELPVAYRPSFGYSSSTVGDVIDVVRPWKQAQKPAEAGGEWIFGLSLYSAVDGDLGRPLLELRRLRSRIEG